MKRCALILAALLAGCGGSAAANHPPRTTRTTGTAPTAGTATTATTAGTAPTTGTTRVARSVSPARTARLRNHDALALVTAETENRLLVVDLRSGRVIRRIPVPADPENVVSAGSVAVVVSSAARTVTLLDQRRWRITRELRGFDSPHIPAVFPGEQHAYVTDDAAGTLTVIRLTDGAVVSKVEVGPGAHHLSASPSGRRLWIALGESARAIVILDTSNPNRPRVIGRLDPGFAVHDVLFSPDGRRVWVSSAGGPDVAVLDARTHLLLFRVRVGPPPQHIAFESGYAYLTSGYGGRIEKVDANTGTVLAHAATPYGSFELDAAGGYVASASLLRGTLAVFDPRLRLRRVVHLAPATRDLAISTG